MLGVTIRMNGSTDSVSVDGRTFDRSAMALSDRNRLRRMIVEAFRKQQNA